MDHCCFIVVDLYLCYHACSTMYIYTIHLKQQMNTLLFISANEYTVIYMVKHSLVPAVNRRQGCCSDKSF